MGGRIADDQLGRVSLPASGLKPVLVRGMWGLGDNIFSRPFVRDAALKHDVWLDTPWPELYSDLDIKFVRGSRNLRTQQKNIAKQPSDRWTQPHSMREFRVAYTFGAGSIIRSMAVRWASLGVDFEPKLFDLPDTGPSPVVSHQPIAVIRPVTVRSEWRNEARNPLPEYVAQLASELMATHHVVAVADLASGHEWTVGDLPPAHCYLVHGELSVRELLALIRVADIVVGGVGWIVPAGLALKVKTFAVLGGNGGHNAPDLITDRRIDLSRIGFAMPEKFCKCTNMRHGCDKTIADLSGQFSRWWSNFQVAA